MRYHGNTEEFAATIRGSLPTIEMQNKNKPYPGAAQVPNQPSPSQQHVHTGEE